MAAKNAFRGRKKKLRLGSLTHLRSGRFSILLGSLTVNMLSLAMPVAILQVYDRVLPNNAQETLFLLVVGIFAALFLEALLRVGRTYVSSFSGAQFEHETGVAAVDHLLTTSLTKFEETATGLHLERLNALNVLRDFYSGQLLNSIVDFGFIFIFLGLIAVIGGWLVAVPIAMIILFGLIASHTGSQLREALQERMDADERRYNFIIETLEGVHTVKSMAMESMMIRRHDQLQRRCAENDLRTALASMGAINLGGVFSQVTMILVAAAGSILVVVDQIVIADGVSIPGNLTMGALAACTLLSGRAIQPMQRAFGLWSQYQSIKLARKRLQEIFDMPPENKPDVPDILPLTGFIYLDDVKFRYGPDEPYVFDDLHLNMEPGETIVVRGDNGVGKTTLLWLIMGALRPTEGIARIDGMDPEDFDANSVRRQVAYLPQHGVLFKGTILENITNFRKDVEVERVIEIATRLGLDEIIMRLPDGYDTKVGDSAFETLPRGIKQRIALARALIDYPRIVLFDEANTSLDAKGDRLLTEVLADLKRHCTMILVSHRPTTQALADRVMELRDGKLWEVEPDLLENQEEGRG